ncbi:MAG: carboxylate/amino acid/amine transporter [Hyphomicrobiales bacterium]|jgi:drug/metabolite transporter (DMT)-like permease|nr:carboxylate/amino acid/amine transporter [Hyphomicrobiales bacterium]
MLTGIAFKIASTLFFSAMLALVKYYSAYPVSELVFFRSSFALIPLVFWLLSRGDFPRALHTRNLGGHLVRSIAGVGSMSLMFAAYGFLPLADVTAIGYAGPLLIVVFSALLLREKVTLSRWSAVMIGFAGVIVMLWEHLGRHADERASIGALCAFFAAVLVSIAMIQTRRLTKTEDTGAIVFYFQTSTTLASMLVMFAAEIWPDAAPFAGAVQSQAWVTPTLEEWWPLIALGLLGGVGQIFMTQSYRYADASIIACFDYTSMIWALIIGLLFFSEAPRDIALVGAAIIAFGGLLAIYTERAARKR